MNNNFWWFSVFRWRRRWRSCFLQTSLVRCSLFSIILPLSNLKLTRLSLPLLQIPPLVGICAMANKRNREVIMGNATYEGETKEGMKHGMGTLNWDDGDQVGFPFPTFTPHPFSLYPHLLHSSNSLSASFSWMRRRMERSVGLVVIPTLENGSIV